MMVGEKIPDRLLGVYAIARALVGDRIDSPPTVNKYRNIRTQVDGRTFASGKEAKRYNELKLLEHAGKVSLISTQPRYHILVNGIPICTYVADFKYKDQDGVDVIEDVKGFRTPLYRVKKSLMMAIYGIDVKEP